MKPIPAAGRERVSDSTGVNEDFFVRDNADGALDSFFGGDGIVFIQVRNSGFNNSPMALPADEKILIWKTTTFTNFFNRDTLPLQFLETQKAPSLPVRFS